MPEEIKMTVHEEFMRYNPGSFRDPASRVFNYGHGSIMRRINKSYFPEYKHLMESGLYNELLEMDLIIPHKVIAEYPDYIVIEPQYIPFISYPYEWPFHMLKEAAANTLEINRIAMNHGMILKDAPAYNMQLLNGRMVLIDTASFMFKEENRPWGAYSQFLRHFVVPLLFRKYRRESPISRLSSVEIDGVQVSHAAKLLPFRARLSPKMWIHIYSQALNFAVNPKRSVKMNSLAVDALLGNLAKFIRQMEYKPMKSDRAWINYSDAGSYSDTAIYSKDRIVTDMLMTNRYDNKTYLDLGCNTGKYSFLLSIWNNRVIAVDSSHDCINEIAKVKTDNITPLVMDICNPSAGIGWNNHERESFWTRVGDVDCILALALIHHLCITNNVPLAMVAELMADHARNLIIEWIPPDDPKAQQLMGNKHIPEYSHKEFLEQYGQHFRILETHPVYDSGRIIYKMERKG